jgi:outer membrane protein assembly factor BamE
MYKLIFLCLLGSLLTACALLPVHKLEVEQGNVMLSSTVNRLHPGMSENQVKAIMGTPILVDILSHNCVSYVYTFQIGSNPRTEKQVILYFRSGTLQTIQRQGI